MRGCLRFQIIWVSGTRQIEAVIDGLPRSFLKDGIASSGSILEFVTFNETAFERSALLLSCVHTYIGLNNIEYLTPEGWFEEGHGMKGVKKNDYSIWAPYHSKGTFYERRPLWWKTWC